MSLPGQKNILYYYEKTGKHLHFFSQTAFCNAEFHLMDEKNYSDFWNRPHPQGALLKRTTGLTLNAFYHPSEKCSILGGPGLSDIKRSEVKNARASFSTTA